MNDQTVSDEPSAGLAFMQAARTAMPKTLGDRERISAMSEAMSLAIRARFAFDLDDAAALGAMSIRTCVGVFRPLDEHYYRSACKAGGTYPRMWEAARGIRAWRAAYALHGEPANRPEFAENARIAPNIALLMPSANALELAPLAHHEGCEVWWCTDFDDDAIKLCRYRPADDEYGRHFRRPGGAPARRMQLTREEWDKCQAQLTLERHLSSRKAA